jgi:hypothetical protein
VEITSRLPSAFGHKHISSTSSSSDDCLDGSVENSEVQEYSSELEDSCSNGTVNHQKVNENLQHGEYQQLFARNVHFEGSKDDQGLKLSHSTIGLQSEERAENPLASLQ